jgi:hypothetical protein
MIKAKLISRFTQIATTIDHPIVVRAPMSGIVSAKHIKWYIMIAMKNSLNCSKKVFSLVVYGSAKPT